MSFLKIFKKLSSVPIDGANVNSEFIHFISVKNHSDDGVFQVRGINYQPSGFIRTWYLSKAHSNPAEAFDEAKVLSDPSNGRYLDVYFEDASIIRGHLKASIICEIRIEKIGEGDNLGLVGRVITGGIEFEKLYLSPPYDNSKEANAEKERLLGLLGSDRVLEIYSGSKKFGAE